MADAFSVHGVRSPLVGRDAELREMSEAVARAIDFQAPQLITVIGNQGTGKSRLCDELCTACELSPQSVLIGRATRNGPRYGAITSLLRARFGLAEAAPEEVVREKLLAEVERVFGDARMAEVVHFLGHFLGGLSEEGAPASPFLRAIAETPSQLDEVARTMLRRFIEVDAASEPRVLIFDDLQWADDDTLSLLRELGTHLGGAAVVLIGCARPELLVRFADWGAGDTDHLRVDLRNLEPDHAELMLRNLLARVGTVPQEILDDAVEMTGGNPYFLEQLVRLFLANGTIDANSERWRIDPARAANTELPISIEEAIEARVAALETPERDVLEKGAVFGNVFWTGAIVALTRLGEQPAMEADSVASISDFDFSDGGEGVRRRIQHLVDELVDRDYLLRLDPEDSTIAGDEELVFKHNLERELIAKSTEAARTRRYHRTAAQWLETKLGARSEEQLEFLAQLYERGGDRRRAANCYLAGADKARLRYAIDQAPELYRRGLAMLGDEDAVRRLEALHNLGDVLDTAGETDEALIRFSEMLRLAWLFDHKAKGGAAHGRLGRIYRRRGDYEQAIEHLRAANDLFQLAADRRGIAGTLDDIGKVEWLRGAYGEALELFRQALAIRRALGDRRSIALSLANIGRVHHDRGAFKAALSQFREALDLRRDIGDLAGVVQSLCDLGGVHAADANLEMALEMFSEAQHIARQIGDKLAQASVLSRLGECKMAMGRGTDAVAHLEEATAISTELGDRVGLSDHCRRLAEVHVALGDPKAGEDCARRALAISEAVGSRVQAGNANRALAEAVAAGGFSEEERARAEECFRRAIDILADMKNELELARCYRAFAAFRERSGHSADAAKLRKRADEIFGRLRGAASVE